MITCSVSACKAGYEHLGESEDCGDIDECSSDIDDCSPEEICINTEGSWRCCLPGYQLAADNETCTDIDECQSGPDSVCSQGQDCFNTPGSHVCCDAGYTLAEDNQSCTDIDECEDIESKKEMKKIPPLPQKYFVLLWKSLYALFLVENEMPETEREQSLYHAVSVVGTLLLQIGEVGHNLMDSLSQGGDTDTEWSITFEQFLANILTESVLVEEFSQKVNVEEALKSWSTDLKRLSSENNEISSRSVFYV